MRLPRDLGGKELVHLLVRYGYRVTRQTGSHVRLTSVAKDHEHHCTIPLHKPLRVGTLNSVLKDVASYLEKDRRTLLNELFE